MYEDSSTWYCARIKITLMKIIFFDFCKKCKICKPTHQEKKIEKYDYR